MIFVSGTVPSRAASIVVSTLAFHATDSGSIPAIGVDFYVFFLRRFIQVLFEFVFLIRVPQSSSQSFSINTKHTIKALHFLAILGNMSVLCNCQFRTILYVLVS